MRAAGLLLDSVSEEEKKRKKEREKGELRLPSFPHQNRDRKFKKKKKNSLSFGSGTADDVALSSGMKAPVLAAYAVLRSRALPDVPAKYSWIQDEIEQLTLCKVCRFRFFFCSFFFGSAGGSKRRERERDNKEKLTSFFFSTFPLDHAKKNTPNFLFSTAVALTGAR